MLKDAKGKEITLGCTVRHLHGPTPFEAGTSDDDHNKGYHSFAGTSVVESFAGPCAIIRPNFKGMIPVFLGSLLVVTNSEPSK